jgi:cytochrome c553
LARCFLLACSIGALILSAQFALAQPEASTAPDTMQARLTACFACHGARGEGVASAYFPRLSGKPAGYLFNQLSAFRSGRRRYPPMNALLKFMPDPYLHAMAGYFAADQAPLPATSLSSASTAVLAHGRMLATHGDAARGIPACILCHNPAYTGMEPGIPGLLGLQADYISAQLGAWRYGTRTATAPDCMQIVASHLTEADVTAVAAWIATVPAAAGAAPIAQGSLRTPLACGSEPQ